MLLLVEYNCNVVTPTIIEQYSNCNKNGLCLLYTSDAADDLTRLLADAGELLGRQPTNLSMVLTAIY